MQDPGYVVYIIANADNRRTYVGCTNNTVRRIRQHNQDLVGGARATKCSRTWAYVAWIRGFGTRSDALSFEWHCKRQRGRGRTPICRRVDAVNALLSDGRWRHLDVVWAAESGP